MANINAQKLLKAFSWLKGNPTKIYDIKNVAMKLKTISDACNIPGVDGRDILMNFESETSMKGISFSDMTKDQQLRVMSIIGRDGPAYHSFISNAASHILLHWQDLVKKMTSNIYAKILKLKI